MRFNSTPASRHRKKTLGNARLHITDTNLPQQHATMATSNSNDKGGQLKIQAPQGNDNPLQKAAAPLATLSSHADPWPHYIMSGACGAAAYHSWANLNNPRMAGMKLALGAAYLWSGRLLVTGNPTLGYDMGTISSAALLALSYPRVQATGEMAATIMATLGGVSTLTNVIKSYEMRTGKPKELEYKRD